MEGRERGREGGQKEGKAEEILPVQFCAPERVASSARLWVTTEAKAGLVFRKQELGTHQQQGAKPHMGSRKPVQDLQPLGQVSKESRLCSQRSFSSLWVCE